MWRFTLFALFFSVALNVMGEGGAGVGSGKVLAKVFDDQRNRYELVLNEGVGEAWVQKFSNKNQLLWRKTIWAPKGQSELFGTRAVLDLAGTLKQVNPHDQNFAPSEGVSTLAFEGATLIADLRFSRTFTNLYVLSIGIDHYGDGTFDYCRADADRIGDFVRSQFMQMSFLSNRAPVVHVLLDDSASFDRINQLFHSMARQMKQSDIFVFNFAGCSVKLNNGDVNFYLPGSYIAETFKTKEETDVRNPRFNLLQLKNWLNLLPAQRQLLVSEAGDGSDFALRLQQVVMGTDPLESVLSNRNRVVATTSTLGFENATLGGGALASFMMRLENTNVFDLFDANKRERVRTELYNIETGSVNFRENIWNQYGHSGYYTRIFFEAELLDQLRGFQSVLGGRGATRGGEAEVSVPPSAGITASAITNYALVIGINDYDSPSWADLVNPVNDARQVAEELRTMYGFKTEVLENPTKLEISQALYRYSQIKFDSLKSQLLVFWAGHGGYDDFVSGYLVARDSRSRDEDPLRDTYLEHSKLRNMLSNIKCPHVMLVLDACFGGTFDQRVSKSGHRGEKDDPLYQPVADAAFLKRKLANRSRLYLTSGGKTYVPDGRPGAHSPFARQFLTLLRESGDGIITFSEIKVAVEKLQPEPCAGEFDGNEPGGDFLLIRKK